MPVAKAVSGAKAAHAAQPKGANGHGTSTANVDDLSAQEVEERRVQTIQHLDAIIALWPGLRYMSENERATTNGKALSQLSVPLRMLFNVLMPTGGNPSPLARHFDGLGNSDLGKDPNRFEADLLLRRMDRHEAEQEVHDKLAEMVRHFGDDMLWTAAAVVGPGKLGIEQARTLAKANDSYRMLLQPLLTALAALTKPARNALKIAAGAADPGAATDGASGDGSGAAAGGKTSTNK